jgi:hypothetical protein
MRNKPEDWKKKEGVPFDEEDKKRFKSKFVKKGKKACWLWTDTPNHRGYGRISISGRTMLAHRLAWALDQGLERIPTKTFIHHRCGNPLCVNPAHLYEGSPKERGRLMSERSEAKTHCFHCRGRQRDKKGRYILTDIDEAEIQRLYRTGCYTPEELMDHFRIDDKKIKRILKGVKKDMTRNKSKIDDLWGGRG